TIVVDHSVTTRIKRAEIITNEGIRAGSVIVGLASCGTARYETGYNSGMGSNGLSSARHDVFHRLLAQKYPESYDPRVPTDLAYTGSYDLLNQTWTARIDDSLDELHNSPKPIPTMGKMVLSPTRTYAPVMKEILSNHRQSIHGLIHCTGGGQTKVMKFVDQLHIVKDKLLPTPPLFQVIHHESQTDWREMYQVFNMGHRLEIYTDEKAADEMTSIARSFGVEAQIIGYVEASDKTRLSIRSRHGEFVYA
ncbi:MAG: phosphoribosylformylglycinamidine cyclo-ligase, partial [Bacteroidia bacterium]|nr:phosphoribosylformylglycinamidine cyclo-ligase [Bacteroidia bacterium]